MRSPRLKPAAAVLAAALASACLLLPDPGDEPGWRTFPDEAGEGGIAAPAQPSSPAPVPAPAAARADRSDPVFRQTLDFPPGGALTLENDYGDVSVAGWDRESVEVVVAPAGPSDPPPEVEVRRTAAGLVVRTRSYEGAGAPPGAVFTVRAPFSVDLAGLRVSVGHLRVSGVRGRLEASIDKGDLAVTGFSGTVMATLGDGKADLEVRGLRDADAVTVLSRRGDIVLRLERGAGAIVEADASEGVRSEFDLGVALPVPAVRAWIGQGGPNIILRASGGRVDLVAAAKEPASARPASGN